MIWQFKRISNVLNVSDMPVSNCLHVRIAKDICNRFDIVNEIIPVVEMQCKYICVQVCEPKCLVSVSGFVEMKLTNRLALRTVY